MRVRDISRGEVKLPDSDEFNFTLDYRYPGEGWPKGMWLRFRVSVLDEDGAEAKQRDFRVIFNYDFTLL